MKKTAVFITIGTVCMFLVNLADFIVNGFTIIDRIWGNVEEKVNVAHANFVFDETKLSTTSPINQLLVHVNKNDCIAIFDISSNENKNSFVFQEVKRLLRDKVDKVSLVGNGKCRNIFKLDVESRYIKENPIGSEPDSDGLFLRKIGFSLTLKDSTSLVLFKKEGDVVGVGSSKLDARSNAEMKIINWLNRNL